MEHLRYRIAAIYGSLKEVEPQLATTFRPRVYRSDRAVIVEQDFRGGLSSDEIRRRISQVVYQVAHAKDIIKNQLRAGGSSIDVEAHVNACEDLQIIVDLANVDKHGYPLRRFRSRHSPKLGEVGRSLQMTLPEGSGAGAHVGLRQNMGTGESEVVSGGGGRGETVFWGEVLDAADQRVGDVLKIASQALAAWERLLRSVGILAKA